MSPRFKYRVVDTKGQRFEGSIDRENEHSAASVLRASGYYITKLSLEEETTVEKYFSNLTYKTKPKDLAIFCRQLATMIEAGVPFMSCLTVLIEQTENKQLKQVLKEIKFRVSSGESLADAMEGYPKIFPELMVTMIKAGELGGVLDEVLNRLAVQFEREYKFREKIKNVMTYPSFVGMVTVVVVFFLLVWVIPMFSYVFINMDLDLPLPTRILLDLGVLLKKYWYLIIIFNLAIIVGLKKYINSEKGRYGKDKLLLFIPIIGDIITKVNIARFSQTLSTLLSGGIPILQALAAVEKTVENKVISDSITVARVGVSQGVGLAKSLAVSGFFPPMVIEMIAIGEESGALDSMLSKVADFYETETEFTLNRITSIIEPLMIIFMSMIVGGIAAAILLPMFDLINLGW